MDDWVIGMSDIYGFFRSYLFDSLLPAILILGKLGRTLR